MQEIVFRMRRVSADLREIRRRMELIRSGPDENHQMVGELLQLDLIRDFKSSVDEMRSFLWDYFQEIAKGSGTTSEPGVQEFRLKRATEMLRSVQDDITLPSRNQAGDAKSLFETLQELADFAVERHITKKD
jgi:hypothetical protein